MGVPGGVCELPWDTLEEALAALDGWERLSEMPEEVAWYIAFVVGRTDLNRQLERAARRYSPFTPRLVEQSSEAEVGEWLWKIVPGDPLAAWKIALTANLAEYLADTRGGQAAGAKMAVRMMMRVEAAWTVSDDVPSDVAVVLVDTVAGGSRTEHLCEAVSRYVPEGVVGSGREQGDRSAVMEMLGALAACDVVRGLKAAVEAQLRKERVRWG